MKAESHLAVQVLGIIIFMVGFMLLFEFPLRDVLRRVHDDQHATHGLQNAQDLDVQELWLFLREGEVMKRALILTAAILLTIVATPSVASEEPAGTKLEAFQGRAGVAMLREYVSVGKLRHMGTIEVSARLFRDMARPGDELSGISIEVTESGRLERSTTAYIDKDEIDALLQGIDFVGRDVELSEGMENFESEYSTNGNLRITVFNDAQNRRQVAIAAGRVSPTRAYLSIDELGDFRRLIVKAQRAIAR